MTKNWKSNPAVVAWGELVWDLFPEGKRLGGCAANVAHHLAQLGANARLVTRVGTDPLGRDAISRLAATGVQVDLVQVDPHRATGTVAVEVTGGEPRFAIATEAAWDAIVYSDAVAQAVVDADVLYYGTLAQRTALGSGALRQAWLQAPKACLRVCDVNIRAPAPPSAVVKASLAAADAVKLNEQELAFLANMFDVKTPVRWLMEEFGIGLVALTRGERGCAMFRPDMQVEHDGFPISDGQGDPVGAGDAFTAVLCDALARGIGIGSRSALEALAERANRIASYVASCPGATPALPDRLC